MNVYKHNTVLLDELIQALNLKEGSVAIDCTMGGGGHTQRLVQAVYTTGKVIGIDRDYAAIQNAQATFALSSPQIELIHAPFSQLKYIVRGLGLVGKVDAICADLGVSSVHIDDGKRGFSFRQDGPLDMRMDQNNPKIKTAADLCNNLSREELAHIFKTWGEEPKAWAIAGSIVTDREATPFQTTTQLANLVTKHWPHNSRKHPATRVFQALRVAVNDECGELKTLVEDGFELLKPGGRLGLISFHSLEDRIIKQSFQKLAGKVEKDTFLLRHLPHSQESTAVGKIIKPFPLIPTEEEIAENVRSRSAKLRVIEKI